MSQKVIQKLAADPVLEGIIQELNCPPIQSTNNVFHDLLSCIIEQQIHYRSTKHFFKKRMENAGLELLTLENFSVFEEKALHDVKLSERKFETLHRTVSFFSKNKIDWQNLSDDAVRTQLKSIKGIGPWTQDMILLYTLERPDIFPADDYHLKKLMTALYGLNPKSKLKAQMREISAEWSPYRSFGVRYLLAWKAQMKKKVAENRIK